MLTYNLGKTHLCLFSNTRGGLNGADRDFVSIVNALDPKHFRVTWVGSRGCEDLRPYVNDEVVTRFIDLDYPVFSYLVHENVSQPRSLWLWTKIIADHWLCIHKPLRQLREILANDLPQLVVSNTSVVMLGAAFARKEQLPHLWCIKEFLNPNSKACRIFAAFAEYLSNAVTVPSKAMSPAFSDKVYVIPDGNDIAQLTNPEKRQSRTDYLCRLDLPTDLPVVAQVGFFGGGKGQLVSAEALIKLATVFPEPICSMIYFGGGSGEYANQLKGMIDSLPAKWRKLVRFSNFVPTDYSGIAAADIIVHPSILPDPFPNAVREAMILGKPVIGSRLGGLPEMIEDDVTGILCEPNNAEALACDIQRLIDCPAERERIGNTARSFALSYFDINIRKQPFQELFFTLAAGQKPSKATIVTLLGSDYGSHQNLG